MLLEKVLNDESVKKVLASLEKEDNEAVKKNLTEYLQEIEQSLQNFEKKVKSIDLTDLRREIIRIAKK